MAYFVNWLIYMFSAIGLTVLIVWPATGPSAFLRDRIVRHLLPGKAKEVLDCYICTSFWASLALAGFWQWLSEGQTWRWFGCLMVPAVFWFVLRDQN